MDTNGANQSVIVFGAGEAGRRALACLRREPAWDVIGFADNAPQRHGTTFEGLPIVPPGLLPSSGVDRVVIASESAPQILPQLRSLGIDPKCVDVYQFSDDEIHPIPLEEASWPRILVLTDLSISAAHGSGAAFLRQFEGYPRERLVHAYLQRAGDPVLPHAFRIASLTAMSQVGRASGAQEPAVAAPDLVAGLQASHGSIDLIYSTVGSEAGLTVLEELLDALPVSIPVIHHLIDVTAENGQRFDALLRAISPRVTELWAAGPALAERVQQVTNRQVIPMAAVATAITSASKQQHRDLDSSFTAVMLGSSHMPWIFDKVRTAWAEVRRAHGVGPIRWFAYPTAYSRVERAGVRLDPDIEYVGYLSDRILHEQLCSADLAIVPFNIADEPESAHVRYAIPSRLGKLVNAGLPIFAAAGRNTETRRFIAHHGIGRCSTLADADQFTRDLLAIVRDTAARRVLGRASRNLAVGQCDIARYRERLFARIGALTGFDFAACGRAA